MLVPVDALTLLEAQVFASLAFESAGQVIRSLAIAMGEDPFPDLILENSQRRTTSQVMTKRYSLHFRPR